MTQPSRGDYAVAADVVNDLGRHVFVVRTALGLTQRDVAERVDVTHTAIAKLERRHATPSLAVVVRLLRWLDAVTVGGDP